MSGQEMTPEEQRLARLLTKPEVKKQGRIAIVTINRPEVNNALAGSPSWGSTTPSGGTFSRT